jgi:hypothetical protein
MGVYAGLGVPELWRFDGTALHVYHLDAGGDYQLCAQSPSPPFLPLADLVPLLQQSVTAQDDREVLRALRAWVRDQVLPARAALAGGQPLPRGTSPGP